VIHSFILGDLQGRFRFEKCGAGIWIGKESAGFNKVAIDDLRDGAL